LKKILRAILTFLNKLLPKYDQVIIEGVPNIEGNAIAVANYIADNYSIPVYFVVNKNSFDDPSGLLSSDVNKIYRPSIYFFIKYMTSRYIFFTHGSCLDSFSKKQIVTNIWHGIFYKRIGKFIDHPGIAADITVSTSKLTQKMFSEAFGVKQEDVFICGYPRNDILINSKRKKELFKKKISQVLNSFGKMIVWLPTYRKSVKGDIRQDGNEVGNPFYIENFDVQKFNRILKDKETLCLVKPHPMAPEYDYNDRLSNVKFIDDQWLSNQNMTLYHLLGCSDLLISDVSSVIIDYLLMDQPIICISTDLDEYKKTRGFYFDDIEDWIPGKILQDQYDFFHHLELLLSVGANDLFKQKREKLRNTFFSHQDSLSSKRLAEQVFSKKENR
jgi:CDP-glycerol glycerophosphotransferase (TagB/SpsB family)